MGTWRTRILFTVGAFAVGLALWFGGEAATTWGVLGVEWVRHAGWIGVAAFLIVYAVSTWAMVPASWLQMPAGFLFGPVVGFGVALGLSTLTGSVSFLLARTALREPIKRRIVRGGWLQTLDRAIGEGGIPMVVLLRISPISPYNTINYVLGLSPVRFRDYVIGTLIGGAFPALLYALIGASVSDLAVVMSGESSGPEWIQWVGLGVTVVATIGVTARVRSVLRRHHVTSTVTSAP